MQMPASVVIVMGVSGSGKSSLAQRLAQVLGVEFVEGDALHTAASITKMAAGIPLTDEDRAGWLQALAARLAEAVAKGVGLVATCSALKRSYRDVLRTGAPALRLVYLHGDRALLAARMSARTGHYMPTSLLDSQLETLEPPQADEAAIQLDLAQSLHDMVAQAAAQLDAPEQIRRP
jgi:carbohydrate kinase (thermoresistant glucokinase family)